MGYSIGTKCINVCGEEQGSAWISGALCTITHIYGYSTYGVVFEDDRTDMIINYTRHKNDLVPANKFFRCLYGHIK